MNPSIKKIIEAFQAEIEAQKLNENIGIKGAADLVNTLEENLRDFAQNYCFEECEVCGAFTDDCRDTKNYDLECAACRDSDRDMRFTYEMLKQVR